MDGKDYILTDSYHDLAAAIVEQAVIDYRTALRRLYLHPLDHQAKRMLRDCEMFFKKDIGAYSSLDGYAIMKAVNERVYREVKEREQMVNKTI